MLQWAMYSWTKKNWIGLSGPSTMLGASQKKKVQC